MTLPQLFTSLAACSLIWGCASSTRTKTYSPTARHGVPVWYSWHHGGSSSDTPSDYVMIKADEDTNVRIIVRADPVAHRPAFMGILFPIIPVPIPYYPVGTRDSGGRKETLKVHIHSSVSFPENRLNQFIRVVRNDTTYECRKLFWKRNDIHSVDFKSYSPESEPRNIPVPGPHYFVCETSLLKKETDEFSVSFSDWNVEGVRLSFDTIRFKRALIKMRHLGP